MERNYVCQFSVDVQMTSAEYAKGDMAERIEEALIAAGIDVVSDSRYSWQATWTEDGYFNSEDPISSD